MSVIKSVILAIDPGRQKCGLAVVDDEARVLYKTIIQSATLADEIHKILNQYPVSVIVLGDRTTSRQAFQLLKPFGLEIQWVDEDRSSIEGRQRYLRENTKGLARLLPIGLRVPDRPFDDYVAVILAERFLSRYGK
ncbi:RNase H-fold protein (predicted Holliday junction resolvase) [Hydrogenispora ethanolica]|uniref:RNase H-fold protein (Predicted Holliday junction resolvase) n=1 Tax=Hydrogenispora ethanolica TaxID=1082276 RepID=A0A4R1RD25_HYDET|nr:Holliday junction resolvase RuvX [Hydrogenispora ethanolica]TCL63738.1 RNase H-fold protein (predicted Holliday junction resolvase) [Hydrogenispora ethanolica]